MSTSLENVRFDLGQTVPEYHKAFTNFMDYQTQKFSNNIFFRYYSLIDGKPGFKTLTYAQVDHLATNLACKWFEHAKGLDTVGFIADHSVHYGIAIIAFLKLRTTMLCLSPRNSEAADVNLLEKTNCKLLIVNEKYDHIAKNSAAQVPGVKTICIQNFDIEELLKEPLNPNAVTLIDTKFSDEDITKAALIIHR
jgi:acyl-CoA synthetase (AMP-forming)/AMP-acid ligase II